MTWRSLNKNRKATSKKKSKSPKNQIRNITEPGKQRLMYGSSLRSKDLLISDGNHAALGSFQYKVMAFTGHCSRMNSCDIPCIFGHRVRVRSGFRTHNRSCWMEWLFNYTLKRDHSPPYHGEIHPQRDKETDLLNWFPNLNPAGWLYLISKMFLILLEPGYWYVQLMTCLSYGLTWWLEPKAFNRSRWTFRLGKSNSKLMCWRFFAKKKN